MGKILVVDDQRNMRTTLAMMLRGQGYEVDEAADGPSALTHLEDRPGAAPDLVLLDIGLPGIDGLEVLRRVRSRSDVYVLLVTARPDVRARRLAGRGRESAEDIEARLQREGAPVPDGIVPVIIDNSGGLDDGIDAFVGALRSIAD